MSKIARKRNPNTRQFWEDIYKEHIDQKKIRSDGESLLKFLPRFEKAESILDFGGGMGGNMKFISEQVKNTRFILVDHSEASLGFVKNELLGEKDERGNSFEYNTDLDRIPDNSIQMVVSFQTLEHITEYKLFMDRLWSKVTPGGTMLISVPVRGIRDRNRQHVNKFTVNSMFRILLAYNEIVHISPRSYSKNTAKPTTAYFYVEKAR